MEIRSLAAAYRLGEFGRPAVLMGGKSGPATFFSSVKDIVSLGGKAVSGAGLYSSGPTFKVVGAVELLSGDVDGPDEQLRLGDVPFLL